MKIGILTFHYATNYGAVLQAYALQRYLNAQGYDTDIIDYVPFTRQKPFHRRVFGRTPSTTLFKIIELLKERNISRFRERHLKLTKHYNSLIDLQASPPVCDAYISGSDQIWNAHFTTKGECKPTLSYFLDFGPRSVKRISYAASFGCTSYPQELIDLVKPCLRKFNALSVRENTGQDILKGMGLHDVQLMPDPTLLLERKEYNKFLVSPSVSDREKIFVYALHPNQTTIRTITSNLKSTVKDNATRLSFSCRLTAGVEDWLNEIAQAKGVITNSFHGVVFSIIFEKPFIVVPVEGPNTGMNDRLYTLLKQLNLEDRLVDTSDPTALHRLLAKSIDWHDINGRIFLMREKANQFLHNALGRLNSHGN